jgi:hypothetical protein
MKKNGGMWRSRIRGGPCERRALRNTIEDFKNRASNQHNPIRSRPKWFTDRYIRNLVEVNAAWKAEGNHGNLHNRGMDELKIEGSKK